jgi:hypothetical protein
VSPTPRNLTSLPIFSVPPWLPSKVCQACVYCTRNSADLVCVVGDSIPQGEFLHVPFDPSYAAFVPSLSAFVLTRRLSSGVFLALRTRLSCVLQFPVKTDHPKLTNHPSCVGLYCSPSSLYPAGQCGVPVPLKTDAWKGKKVVLFGVPGAFTPTCSVNQCAKSFSSISFPLF